MPEDVAGAVQLDKDEYWLRSRVPGAPVALKKYIADRSKVNKRRSAVKITVRPSKGDADE